MEDELARINEEKDLHELFRTWETNYTKTDFDPEPIVRRWVVLSRNFTHFFPIALSFVLIFPRIVSILFVYD